MSAAPPIVLSFAASDPTSGAGLQADLLTLAGMGCHPLSVVTALTVQDTRGVEAVRAVEADWVTDQARTLLEDLPVAAFKIGVVGSVENVAAIAEIIADYPEVPMVLDPVLASGRGDSFADEDLLAALRALLVPQATLVTPNSLELRRLAAGETDDAEDGDSRAPDEYAQRLIALGCDYVLVTGTHDPTEAVINLLYGPGGRVREDRWPRLPDSYHGSGCTLASAITAALVNGLDMGDAVRDAQEYTWQTLAGGFRIGMGQRIPDRFFWARQIEPATDEASA